MLHERARRTYHSPKALRKALVREIAASLRTLVASLLCSQGMEVEVSPQSWLINIHENKSPEVTEARWCW